MKCERIYLSRHGVRPSQVPGWTPPTNGVQAHYDAGLAPLGHEQAEALARRMIGEPIDYIFCSPFLRTIETVLPLARQTGIPIKLEWGLSEILRESWFESFPHLPTAPERSRDFPEIDIEYQSQVIPTYPETDQDIKQRAAATIRALTHSYGPNLFLMGHGASGNDMCNALLGRTEEFSVNFCSLWQFECAGDSWTAIQESDTTHLEAAGVLVTEFPAAG